MINLSGILSGTKSYGKEKITIIKRTKNELKPKRKNLFLLIKICLGTRK